MHQGSHFIPAACGTGDAWLLPALRVCALQAAGCHHRVPCGEVRALLPPAMRQSRRLHLLTLPPTRWPAALHAPAFRHAEQQHQVHESFHHTLLASTILRHRIV